MNESAGSQRWEPAANAGFLIHPRLRQLGISHGFIPRIPGVAGGTDRTRVLEELRPHHHRILERALPQPRGLHTAEQVHGAGVVCVGGEPQVHSGADALISADPSVCLGIYTADCCAVFLWDQKRRAIGLVHSGAKGTALGIVPRTVAAMRSELGCNPRDMVAVLSPCIRPPRYETDFAAEIRAQCAREEIREIWDGGECTGGDLGRFYSYRMEKGSTGRLLAFLSI